MFDFSNAIIKGVALHLVGNKGREEGTKAGRKLLPLIENEQVLDQLKGFFMDSFKMDEYHHFEHETDLMMNEAFAYCGYIFDEEDDLHIQSLNILEHLYNQSTHPSIQGGELYVVLFDEIIADDELVRGIGIFKTEHKDQFLKMRLDEETGFHLELEQGTLLKKLEKGVLVLDTYRDEGFRVLCVDMKGSDARYWKDEFLKITVLKGNSFHTKNYLAMCKDFVKEVVAKDTEKHEQNLILNKSVEYFDKHEQFDFEEFKQEVIKDEVQSQKFETYAKAYKEDMGLADANSFFIEPKAVKQMKSKMKPNLKLDTKIEIKMSGTADECEPYIERGYDEERDMSYYKVYFRKEL